MADVAVTTIIDPSGRAWPLDGSVGLQEQPGRKGFHAPTYTNWRDQSPAVAGAFFRGTRANQRELIIPVVVRDFDRNVTLALRREFMAAISPWRGVCTIVSSWPDGSTRMIDARYEDGIDAGVQGPGEYGITVIPYSLRFVAEDPYMRGDVITLPWALAQDSRLYLPIPGADGQFEVVTSPLLTSVTPPVALNPNSDFESGTTGWTGTNAIFSIDATISMDGVQSGMLNPDGRFTFCSLQTTALIPVVARRTYVAEAWLRCAATRVIAFTVNWYDASSAFMSASNINVSVTAAIWQHVSNVLYAPAGAAFARVVMTLSGTPPLGHTMWADSVIFGEAGGVGVFNPGDLPAYPDWTFVGPFSTISAQNVTTGESWEIDWSAPAGASLTLRTKPGETALYDGGGTNRWNTFAGIPDLWALAPGDNVLGVNVTGATTASAAVLSFSPLYEGD